MCTGKSDEHALPILPVVDPPRPYSTEHLIPACHRDVGPGMTRAEASKQVLPQELANISCRK